MGVRAHLGKLTAYSGIANDYGLLVKRGMVGEGTQTTIDDNGLAVTSGGVERVRVGAIGGGDYGLKVVNAGATVIIDGTSNMFKIAATGTLTPPDISAGPAETSTNVTLSTGLTSTPAYLGFLNYGDGRTLPYETSNWLGDGVMIDFYAMMITVVNTNQTKVTAEMKTRRAGGLSGIPYRYFVFREAAF